MSPVPPPAPDPLPRPPARSALDPTVLARIASLTLRARTVVEGTLSGLHPSAHHGASVEFAEHREYVPGDEPRHVDWKLFAKSDKLHVKRFEHETNLRAYLLLDRSASMGYGDGPLSKLDYARTLAASLAWLLLEQRDAVGLGLAGRGLESYVPARAHRAHLQALVGVLEAAAAEGKGSLARALEELAERIPRRALVVVVSDGLEDLVPLLGALRRVRSRGHDLAFLQVLDRDEVEFPFNELTLFRSLEDERAVLADPAAIRAAYLGALAAHEEELATTCRGHGIAFHRFVTREPLDQALVRYLAARSA